MPVVSRFIYWIKCVKSCGNAQYSFCFCVDKILFLSKFDFGEKVCAAATATKAAAVAAAMLAMLAEIPTPKLLKIRKPINCKKLN